VLPVHPGLNKHPFSSRVRVGERQEKTSGSASFAVNYEK